MVVVDEVVELLPHVGSAMIRSAMLASSSKGSERVRSNLQLGAPRVDPAVHTIPRQGVEFPAFPASQNKVQASGVVTYVSKS